jgi:hypothetical protein
VAEHAERPVAAFGLVALEVGARRVEEQQVDLEVEQIGAGEAASRRSMNTMLARTALRRLAAQPLTGLRHALIGRERIHHVVGEVTIRRIVRKRAAKRSAPTNGLRRDQSCAASHRERRGCSERPSRHERLLSRVPITLASRWSIASAPTAR